jgi:hypothetical protein
MWRAPGPLEGEARVTALFASWALSLTPKLMLAGETA